MRSYGLLIRARGSRRDERRSRRRARLGADHADDGGHRHRAVGRRRADAAEPADQRAQHHGRPEQVIGAAPPRDVGSAPVDFVLVGSLVTLLFLALLQLGIDFYVRNVLAACVADGARYGANADVASADGRSSAGQPGDHAARSVRRTRRRSQPPQQDDVGRRAGRHGRGHGAAAAAGVVPAGRPDGPCDRSGARSSRAVTRDCRHDATTGSALVEFVWLGGAADGAADLRRAHGGLGAAGRVRHDRRRSRRGPGLCDGRLGRRWASARAEAAVAARAARPGRDVAADAAGSSSCGSCDYAPGSRFTVVTQRPSAAAAGARRGCVASAALPAIAVSAHHSRADQLLLRHRRAGSASCG